MHTTAGVPQRRTRGKTEDDPSKRFVAGALKRRAHDLKALRRARPAARRAALALLEALEQENIPPHALAARARAAMSAAGLLWEASIRLAE
jgi:protein-disulfide isomerase